MFHILFLYCCWRLLSLIARLHNESQTTKARSKDSYILQKFIWLSQPISCAGWWNFLSCCIELQSQHQRTVAKIFRCRSQIVYHSMCACWMWGNGLVIQCFICYYFASGKAAEYCDENICFFSVCLHLHNSKTSWLNFANILYLPVAVALYACFRFCG